MPATIIDHVAHLSARAVDYAAVAGVCVVAELVSAVGRQHAAVRPLSVVKYSPVIPSCIWPPRQDHQLAVDEELPWLSSAIIGPVRHPMAPILRGAVEERVRARLQRPRPWYPESAIDGHCRLSTACSTNGVWGT